MIYDDFSEEQMALPVAKMNVKLGPTELNWAQEPSSQFQAEIKHIQRTFEDRNVVMGCSQMCVRILFGHF